MALAIGLVGLGALFGTPTSPIIPTPTTTPLETTVVETIDPIDPEELVISGVATHDPFGGGGENDTTIENIVDENVSTSWQTEHYRDPIGALKPGVGVVASVNGIPGQLQLSGFSRGTVFEIRWADTILEDPSEWERIAAGRAPAGATSVELPPRTGGFWLLWMTDLPLQSDGSYYSVISELRLRP